MGSVKLNDIDNLYCILSDIEIITYLQYLVLNDANENAIGAQEYELKYETSVIYLLEKQREVVLKFKQLLEKEDFYLKADRSGSPNSSS